MKVVCDIECNSLTKPTKIWVIVCKDIDTNEYNIFREVTENVEEKERFKEYATRVQLWIGHNFLEYDLPVLHKLLGIDNNYNSNVIDTLIISRLVNYSRPYGHSISQYGKEFGLEKMDFNDWSKYTNQMEEYCVRDVDICHNIYSLYANTINSPSWSSAINLEHRFQYIVNDLHNNGFSFDTKSATSLLNKVVGELKEIDIQIEKAFPPREVLIREFTPKETKFGTISKTSVPRALHSEIHRYELGTTYRHTKFEPFNPSSHKQLISVLTEAGWKPENKTQSHIDTERAVNRLKYKRDTDDKDSQLLLLTEKLKQLKVSGWKIDETNLGTLPDNAPAPARLLAKRILLEARRRTLTEWLSLVQEDLRIHGKYLGIGAWTHRMAHQNPNTANIPRELKEDGSVKLLGKEMRSLWIAPKKRLLVGVDAEGIQLRIFAHYINDQEFTKSLVEGRKDDKTDPHSLNQRILGNKCRSRQAAKRFIYALLLGAGLWKLSQILECSESETKEALGRLLHRYAGFKHLKETIIPEDARHGYFIGLDGRHVQIPGDTVGERKHLCMSGYLQNGEALIIKKAAIQIDETLSREKELKQWMFVNIVHDELQSEVKNDMHCALRIAKIKADAIKEAGEFYKTKCPMAGSYWNDDHKDYTIGTNWYKTH